MHLTRYTLHMSRTMNRGFTLVELIVYVALTALLASALVVSTVSIQETLLYMKATHKLTASGYTTLERVTRDIRFASGIDLGGSVLESSPGTLVLNLPTGSVTFAVVGGKVTVREGAGAQVPLTTDRVNVDLLRFTRMHHARAEGILVELRLSSSVRGTTLEKHFRTFVQLDG